MSGNYTSDYTMSIAGMNMDGIRYSSETINGSSLLAGPYFVGSFRQRLWIPFSAIDAEDGDPTNNTGSIQVTNCLNKFEPLSSAGISNYGAGHEPGFNGSPMRDGSPSNNCT